MRSYSNWPSNHTSFYCTVFIQTPPTFTFTLLVTCVNGHKNRSARAVTYLSLYDLIIEIEPDSLFTQHTSTPERQHILKDIT